MLLLRRGVAALPGYSQTMLRCVVASLWGIHPKGWAVLYKETLIVPPVVALLRCCVVLGFSDVATSLRCPVAALLVLLAMLPRCCVAWLLSCNVCHNDATLRRCDIADCL